MAKELDVYRDWLGISEAQRPLNYYQLLRVKQFEDDTAKVRDRYRQMNAHVRKYATGDYAAQSQQLLNELAKAMLCLTDAQRKREYDATLGRKSGGEGRRRTIEEILLAQKAIDEAQLQKARSFAQAVGLEIRDALVQQKMVPPEAAMLAYAESIGLPYVDLGDVGVDAALVPQVPPQLARQHSCVPVMIDQGVLLMASSNPLVPDVEEELRLRFEMPVRTVLSTPAKVNEAVAAHFPRDAAAAVYVPPVGKAAAKGQTAAPAAAKSTGEPISREQRSTLIRNYAVIGFNVCVMLTVIAIGFLRGWQFHMSDIFLALLAGAIGGAVGFFLAKNK